MAIFHHAVSPIIPACRHAAIVAVKAAILVPGPENNILFSMGFTGAMVSGWQRLGVLLVIGGVTRTSRTGK
jgi:hypothetical protein